MWNRCLKRPTRLGWFWSARARELAIAFYSLYLSLLQADSNPVCFLLSIHPGFALGGFFSLMSATFAYEDPLSRASEKLVGTKAQTMFIFKEMGRNMWSSGKGFAKVGALYSGYECCIEGVSPEFHGHTLCRHLLKISSLTTHLPSCLQPIPPFHTQFRAKNDIYNSVAGGFLAGATLSRSGGIKAAIGGGAAFAAFSAVIDLWIRKQPAE